MEVLTDSKSSTPVLLPNAKLMELLKKDVENNKKRLKKESQNQKGRKVKNKFDHRDWIQEHVLEYLKGTPCVDIPISKLDELKLKCTSKGSSSSSSSPAKKKRRTLSDSSVSSKSDKLSKASSSGYGLTEAEAIQILNFMPQEPVEIHLMVDDLHERMSETKQEKFLDMIRSYNTSIELDDSKSAKGETQAEEVVDDSIEMLEKAGNHALNDDEDTSMKIKEEI